MKRHSPLPPGNELTAAVTEMLDMQPETCHTPD